MLTQEKQESFEEGVVDLKAVLMHDLNSKKLLVSATSFIPISLFLFFLLHKIQASM